jgi:hypothetical protein
MVGYLFGYCPPSRPYTTPPSSIELLPQGVKSFSAGWFAFHAFFPTPGSISLHEKLSELIVFIYNFIYGDFILIIIDEINSA